MRRRYTLILILLFLVTAGAVQGQEGVDDERGTTNDERGTGNQEISKNAEKVNPWTAQEIDALKKEYTDFLPLTSRAPGTEGNRQLDALVNRLFSESGFQTGETRFLCPVFRPGHASLIIPGREPVRLEVMHPSLMRPGNFPSSEFDSRLIYMGTGSYEDLARAEGVDLKGSLALMDYECGDSWMYLLRFGFSGFIFIGSDSYHYSDSYGKIYNTEVSVPRFFINREEGLVLKDLCSKAPLELHVSSSPSKWEQETLRDQWVIIPGSNETLKDETVLFTAPVDADSIVPSRASGAAQSVNLFILLKLLEDFKADPPSRTVMLAAINGHTQFFLGERHLAWQMKARSEDVARLRDDLAQDIRVADLYRDNYAALQLRPISMDEARMHAVIKMMWQLDEISAETSELRNTEEEQTEEASDDEDDQSAKPIALDGLTEENYRTAISRAIEEKEKEKSGILIKLSSHKSASAALDEDIAELEKLNALSFDELKTIARKAETVFNDEKLFESWRSRLDDSTGIRLPVKGQLQDLVKSTLNEVKMERMAVFNDDSLSEEAKKKELAGIGEQQADLTKVLTLFNKIDVGIGRTRTYYHQIAVHPRQRRMLKRFRDTLLKRYTDWSAEKQNVLDMDVKNGKVRDELGTGRIAFAVHLDLDCLSERIGFCSEGPYIKGDWQRGFGNASYKLAETVDIREVSGPYIFTNTLTLEANREQKYFFHNTDSPVQFFNAAEGTHAFALKNCFSSYGRIFSPEDTAEYLDFNTVHRTVKWCRAYFRELLSDMEIAKEENLKKIKLNWNSHLWSSIVRTMATDEFGGKTTPTIAVPDTILAVYPSDRRSDFVTDGDVVNCITALAGESGQSYLYGLNYPSRFAPTAYALGENEHDVTYTIDKGRIQTSRQVSSALHRWNTVKVLPMFPCREVPIYDRMDPTKISSYPISVERFWIKSATSQSDPQKYGVHGAMTLSAAPDHRGVGPASVLTWRRDERLVPEALMIITEKRRCILNADKEHPEGKGFVTAEDLGPDIFADAVPDMDYLNRFRVDEMKGVKNALVADFLEKGKEDIGKMEEAKKTFSHNAFLLSLYEGLGNEVKAYNQISSMNADMLKSIIIYMALMLPFCYFLQKLIFSFTKLEHEIAVFIVIFVAMYILFRLIHPAFRIAMNPEAIFIAFVLGSIGVFATWILHSYFSAEMSMLFQKTSGLADVGYSTVGQTALLLGVQNMRRRRIRTSLTTATIVLIIFTMLSFSSVSMKMKPNLLRKSDTAPYIGMFYHWPGGRGMDEETARAFETMFSNNGDVLIRRTAGFRETARLSREDDPGVFLDMEALMGIPQYDISFLESRPVIEGRFFSSDTAAEILLTAESAEALDISAEDLPVTLRFRGEQVQLVGLLSAGRLRLIRDLNPRLPLIPLKKPPKKDGQDTGEEGESLEIAEQDVGSLIMDTSALIVMPSGFSRVFGSRPHSISVRFSDENPPSPEEFWGKVNRFLTIGDAKFYISNTEPFPASEEENAQLVSPGVYYISSNYKTSIGGLSRLIIPLIIAGSIILNTLLGTVYERKKEIAIYNAVGLNPTHIFMFFLAEALVYSVIGSVGGYLIGQFTALGLKWLNIFSNVNINFSSLMVVYAILFTIALVLLSTLYPAWVATRTAVPSGRRSWDMPKNDGQRMNVVFPFVYQPRLAPGIIFYVYEYFNNMTEMSLGDIIAEYESVEGSKDEHGRDVYTLVFKLALAPFDLGVTQRAACRAYYDDIVQSYRLEMNLERISGQDRNWVTTNRPFLKKMRQLLLHWRNVDPSEQAWYGSCGVKLIEEGPDADLPSEEEKRKTYGTLIRDRDSVFGAGVPAEEESNQLPVAGNQSEEEGSETELGVDDADAGGDMEAEMGET